MPKLVQVIPNEQWQLVLQFATKGFYLFEGAVARNERGWSDFAFPDKFKNFTFTENAIVWPGARELDSRYLMSKSRPIEREVLVNQVLRLGYQNQAPTPAHQSHHVFGICLYPFRHQQFELDESIGGGHCEMGGSQPYSLKELLNCEDWERHFDQSGCGWAAPFVKSIHDEDQLLAVLVREICRRQGDI